MDTLVFGDSMCGCFSLFKDPKVFLHKYIGTSTYSLSKPGSPKWQDILKHIEAHKNIQCLIFFFGTTDLNFTLYYKWLMQHEALDTLLVAKKYVELVNSIKRDCQKIIISVMPSPVLDKNIFHTLIAYGSLNKEDVASSNLIERDYITSRGFRDKIRLGFNQILREECGKYGIKYANMDKYILDKRGNIREKYIDKYSALNVHLIWEETILDIYKEISCCKIKYKFKTDLKQSAKKFKAEKKGQTKERLKTLKRIKTDDELTKIKKSRKK